MSVPDSKIVNGTPACNNFAPAQRPLIPAPTTITLY